MRLLMSVFVGLVFAVTLHAADSGKRYGIDADAKTYPQTSPKECLTSILKAIENKRFDYLVAQLADPSFVDERVKRTFGGKFEEQVDDTRTRLDPAAVKLLQRFAKDGELVGDAPPTLFLKDVKDRSVSFVKVGDRYYMQHNYKPE
jgi:hypothetical protein